LLLPAVGAWVRVLLQWIESDRSGLGRQPQLSWLQILRAVINTFLVLFFMLALGRAAAELRAVRVEAPVFAEIVTGVLVGVAFWAIYAAGFSTLRADYQRTKQTRRIT
jgi:succinate dehydrogenase hydrophobic anchor subunit